MSGRIRAFNESDYNAIVEIHNQTYPDDPVTVESWCADDGAVNPRTFRARWVYEENGQVLGLAGYRQAGDSPRAGEYELYLLVRPDRRGCGIGAKLYAWLERAVELYRPTNLKTRAPRTPVVGGNFLRDRGWRQVSETRAARRLAFAKDMDASRVGTAAKEAKCSHG